MGSSVGTLSNYYDMLGLSPAASENEIAQAFSKAMGMFAARPMASAAQLALAFETLRNPDRRRAYDASLGIGTPAKPRSVPPAVSFRISARPTENGAHVEQHLGESLRPAAPPDTARPEPRVASFIASSLREIASPDPLTDPVETKPAQQERELDEVVVGEPEDARDAENKAFRLKPVAAAAGGLILAAGVIGTLAGISARDPEPKQAAVTLSLPAPAPHPRAIAPAAVSTPSATPVEAPQPPAEPAQSRPPAKRSIVAQQPRSWVEQQLAQSQPVESATPATSQDAAAADQSSSQGGTTEAAEANLPLPKKVIARTIERIGYSCGDVSSTTAVEGAGPGAYKVICTSGQTYEAKPIRGRYHFRRVTP